MRRHRALQMRRRQLVERSAAQRAALAAALAPAAARLATVDRVRNSLGSSPLAVVAVAAGVALLGWQGALSWATRLVSLYTLLRRI